MATTDRTRRTAPSDWSPVTARDEDGRPLELLLTAAPPAVRGAPGRSWPARGCCAGPPATGC